MQTRRVAEGCRQLGYRCYAVSVDPIALSHYASVLGRAGRRALRDLARAVASSPGWRDSSGAILVAGSEQRPTLILVSDFDRAGAASFEAQAQALNHRCLHLRYVSYDQAQEDCQVLASRLVERFGRDALAQFHFTCIPRGGHIVLGQLSYALGLRREQLQPPYPIENPLVVVDDCSLSGARFHQFIGECENSSVIFAPLYSHPELRTAIESNESKVFACLSAQDLYDYGPDELGSGYSAWKARWLGRIEGDSYWSGLLMHLCFVWNEPDSPVWNPVIRRVEDGWRIVPPELCLKNSSAHGSSGIQVQVQSVEPGPLGPPPNVFAYEDQGQILVGNLDTGEVVGLEGIAADIWRAVVIDGSREAAWQALLSDYDVDPATMEVDLDAFLQVLVSRGLLQKCQASLGNARA